MEPLVSIGIPTRNQARTLPATLASAFGQTHPNVEAIVCDDASTDGTPAAVEAFRASLPPARRERLRYLRHAAALGIGGNFDSAVRAGRGEFAVKVDSDDLLQPAFVERLLRGLAGHPDAAWAHANVEWFADGDGRPLGLAHTRKPAGFEPAARLAPVYLRRSDTCHVVMLRRAAYEAAGGYRTEMKTCEDWLLWLELIMRGHGCWYDDAVLARMRRYAARPVMSGRRLDYIESTRRMAELVEAGWSAKVEARLGLARGAALDTLRRSIAGTYLDVLPEEASAPVRGALLNAFGAMNPGGRTLRSRLCGALPPALVRGLRRARGLPRALARRAVQALGRS